MLTFSFLKRKIHKTMLFDMSRGEERSAMKNMTRNNLCIMMCCCQAVCMNIA